MGFEWRAGLGSQFGAAIDMLENTVRACGAAPTARSALRESRILAPPPARP